MTTTPNLFDPITLRGLTAPHRLWVAPMCQYSADNGVITDWHRAHLGSFAIGRAGLILTEATAISPEGRISPWDAGLWSDEQAESWRGITDFAHSQNVPMGVQLSHAGRKGSVRAPFHTGPHSLAGTALGWDTLGPSPLAFGDLQLPHEMSAEDIQTVVSDFGHAARRAVDAGFDTIEIHAAHGYLLHQFLSPLANQRTDHYGGSVENRLRLTLEVIDAVRAVVPDAMPLLVRISATDWVDGGWDLDQSVELCQQMSPRGVDFVDVSTGGLDPAQTIPQEPGYQVPFAQRIATDTPLLVGAVGLLTTATQAQQVLDERSADVVLMARQFLREPTFALRAARELGQKNPWPPQYERAEPR